MFFAEYVTYWPEWYPRLLQAAWVTAQLSLAGFALALASGVLLAVAMDSKLAPLRSAAHGFVHFMRGVPLLALLLALYFGLPPLGITFDAFWAGVLGLGLHGGAYVAEIIRGGLHALHKGQREAALAVGMTPLRALIFILLPQAVRVMLPPLLNTYVALLKDSSLCALIATDELMLAARAMASEYFLPLHIFILVGLFYFAVAFPLSLLSRALERRLSRGRRAVGFA